MAPETLVPSTRLPLEPAPSYCLGLGVTLGAGIDAITGRITSRSALDETPPALEREKKKSKNQFYIAKTVSELKNFGVIHNSKSIIFPSWEIITHTCDFMTSTESSVSMLFIVFQWEGEGEIASIPKPRLKDDLISYLGRNDSNKTFRRTYGDYFVSKLLYKTKFTVIWKCYTKNESNLDPFMDTLSAVIGKKDLKSFVSQLPQTAEKHKIKFIVQHSKVGSVADDWQFQADDITQSFDRFRELRPKPVVYEAHLRLYSTLHREIPSSIDIDEALLRSLDGVLGLAQFAFFLVGIAPGAKQIRDNRRAEIEGLVRDIRDERRKLKGGRDTEKLYKLLKSLKNVEEMPLRRCWRQKLVAEARSVKYEDIKRQFETASQTEDDDGIWIQFGTSQTQREYNVGPVSSDTIKDKKTGKEKKKETEKYAIQIKIITVPLEIKDKKTVCIKPAEFPVETADGYVVGLTTKLIEGGQGSNVSWCFGYRGEGLELGKKEFVIGFKNKLKGNGKALRSTAKCELHIYYIPSSEYDEGK